MIKPATIRNLARTRAAAMIAVLCYLLQSQLVFAIAQKDFEAIHGDTVFYDDQDTVSVCKTSGGELPGTVPAPYHDIFIKAAAAQGAEPAIIAAIFYAGEHGHSWPEPPPPYGTGKPWATSPANAQGPFQFLPSTWASYGVDGNNDGKTDIQDLTDAAFGAAKYLVASGAKIGAKDGTPTEIGPSYPPSIRNAIWHYNHASWYVEMVFAAYQEFLNGGSAVSPISTCTGGIGIGADGFVFPLKTTKTVIKAGSSLNGTTLVWCSLNQPGPTYTSCHHDYFAADIHAPTGTEVVAARGGTVVGVGNGPQRIRIKGTDGLWYYYQHLLAGSAKVIEGDTVSAGQSLGNVGTAEDAYGTAPHLHFDVATKDNSFCRGRPSEGKCADYSPQKLYLVDPEPALHAAYANLPEN